MLARILRQNSLLKVCAVLFAIVLWLQLTVEQTQTVQRTFEVPLTVTSLPAGYENLEPPQNTVQVTVEGPLRLLDRFKPTDLNASVNLTTAAANDLTTAEVQVTLTSNLALKVHTVNPSRIHVNLVKIEHEVRPLVIATAPVIQNDTRYSVVSGVNQVTLTGSRSRIATVQQVVLQVEYRLFKQTTDVKLTPKALDAEGATVPIDITPAEVPVQVRVEHFPPGIVVPVHAQFQGALPLGFRVDTAITPSSVTVYGQAGTKTAQGLTEVFTAPIPLGDHTSSFSQQAGLLLPAGLVADPATVKVDVNIVAVPPVQRTFTNLPLAFDGKADDLTVSGIVDPTTKAAVSSVDVVVSGPQSSLDALTTQQLQPVVNLARQGPGAPVLPIKLLLPPGVTLVRVTPDQVVVTLDRR